MGKARVTALASHSSRQGAGGNEAAARTIRPDVPLRDVLAATGSTHEEVPDELEHAPQISAAEPVEGKGPERVSFHTTCTTTRNNTNIVVIAGEGNSANNETNPDADACFEISCCACCLVILFALGLGLGLGFQNLLTGDCPAGFSRRLLVNNDYDDICRKNGVLYDFCCRDDPMDPVRWRRLSLTPLIDYDAACPAGYSQLYAGSCAPACGCSQPDASDKTSLKCDMCCKNDEGTCAVIDPDCPDGFSRMRINNDKYNTICGWNGDRYDFCCRDDPTDPVRWRLSLTPLIDYDAACPAGYSQLYAGSCASACGCSQPDASDKTSLKCDMCCKNDEGTCAVIDPDCPDGFGRLPRITRISEYDHICGWNGDRTTFAAATIGEILSVGGSAKIPASITRRGATTTTPESFIGLATFSVAVANPTRMI